MIHKAFKVNINIDRLISGMLNSYKKDLCFSYTFFAFTGAVIDSKNMVFKKSSYKIAFSESHFLVFGMFIY